MIYLTHLSRFFFAATVLAAAMLLAPPAAQAHAGHRHGPVKVERSDSTPHTSSSVRTRDELRSELAGTHDAAWIAASNTAHQKGTTSCADGCCHSAGQGCCAAALPALITVALSPSPLERFFAHFLSGPGITPGVLPEPPRYLV